MAKFMLITIDNSKKAAIPKSKPGAKRKWKNPGAGLYDQLLNAAHIKGNVPADAEGMKKAMENGDYQGWDKLLKEAYLVAPIDKISNSPHGVTPFSRSGCKYPHHVIKGNKLVISIDGLRSAWITARNQGVFSNHTSENKQIVAHLNRHCKELGLKPVWHHGEFYLMEESDIKIEQNFHDINLYLMEKTGINLFDPCDDRIIDRDRNLFESMNESVIEGPPDKPILSSEFNQEVGDTTPQALWKWMHENIEYDKDSNWHLKTAAELYQLKKGNCHDQSYFASFILHSWHYDNWQLFFVEFKDGSEVGGNTHTLTYYLGKDGQYYWFENAWEDQAGIHGPYNYKEDVKNAIMDAYVKDNDLNSHEYDGIVFGENPFYKLGMNLWDYCQSWHLEEEERRFNKSKEENINETMDWIDRFVHDEVFREAAINEPKSISDVIKRCKTPEELLEWMNCIEYGWIDESGKKCGTGEEDSSDHMWKEYRLQSPLQLIRSKVGVCWDQCELQRAWFEKQKYPFAIIYMEIDDDEGKPSHTFLIFKEPGETSEVYWFEHSWGQERGIHKFSDLQQCMLTVTQKFRASQNLHKDPMTLHKLGTHPKYGIRVIPYMEWAHKQFKIDLGDLFYDEMFNESVYKEDGDNIPPNMPEQKEGEDNEPEASNSEGSGEASQTSDVPDQDSEVHEEPGEQEEVEKESMPKKTDKVESSKNGVRRKKLYVAFIEWAKEYNSKNTFGSIFDKDIFHNVYPFVPDEMRYFYRLANPILCVLGGDLTFFQVSELKKLNAKNKQMDKLLIFAATPNDLRIFNKEDKKIYLATENNGTIELGESIGDTFDLYIQKMVNKGDILNGSSDEE
ncbi:MAG: hypothetical protein NC489_22800 [Ruminococcus flavefaciens]|nr:hypothetical protein [Ruminococcus flavefaciens]